MFLLVLALAQPVMACSCRRGPWSRSVVPAQDAVEFPTNGVVRVFLRGGQSPAARESMAREYRLRGADGALVPLVATVDGVMLTLAPQNPLTPSQRYTVERAFPYADGRLITDDERWELDGGNGAAQGAPGAVTLRWYADTTFTTAAGPATDTPPTPPDLGDAGWVSAQGGGDCGPGENVGASLTVPSGVSNTDVIEVEVRGQGVKAVFPVADRADAPIGPPGRLR